MEISPDAIVLWRAGPVVLNATILFTWIVMAILAGGCWLVTRRLDSGLHPSRWQTLLEVVVDWINQQINELTRESEQRYLPFIGTLFLFILCANVLAVVPGFRPPTGSLSTTIALAICVFVAVPVFGVIKQGLAGYLRQYVQPSALMLPFNVIGELSRTVALAVRLFGNIMSGTLIAAILLSVAPLFFPVLMQLLGLLTGVIQAYIFAVLAMVYIGAASQTHRKRSPSAGTN